MVCTVMGIICGIIGIISGAISTAKKRNNELRIRESIIENHVDPETAKILITPETPKEKKPYATLHWGLALFGIGIGFVVDKLLGMEYGLSTFVLMVAGCGLGLLVSFFISYRLEKKA